MNSFHYALEHSDAGPVLGVWRPLLRTRLVGRAEPLFIDTHGDLRSAASLWSGAQVWAQLLRTQPARDMVVWQTERLTLVQLLVAALWEGRTVQIEAASRTQAHDTWCLDGRQILWDGQTICPVADGGWPDLAGPARLSTLDMLASVPTHGDIAVRDRRTCHGDLWRALGEPLVQPPLTPSSTEVLPAFDLATLVTPHEVLNDALLPLLRCTEVWEQQSA